MLTADCDDRENYIVDEGEESLDEEMNAEHASNIDELEHAMAELAFRLQAHSHTWDKVSWRDKLRQQLRVDTYKARRVGKIERTISRTQRLLQFEAIEDELVPIDKVDHSFDYTNHDKMFLHERTAESGWNNKFSGTVKTANGRVAAAGAGIGDTMGGVDSPASWVVRNDHRRRLRKAGV